MVFITLAALALALQHLEAYVKELTSYGLAARAGMGQLRLLKAAETMGCSVVSRYYIISKPFKHIKHVKHMKHMKHMKHNT